MINITDALHDRKTAAEACCQCDGGFYDTPSSPEDDNDGDGASKNNGCSSTNATDAQLMMAEPARRMEIFIVLARISQV